VDGELERRAPAVLSVERRAADDPNVGSKAQQKLEHLQVRTVQRLEDRRVAVRVGRVDVGAEFEQPLADGREILLDGVVENGFLGTIACHDVSAGAYEGESGVRVTVHSGESEGSEAPDRGGLEVDVRQLCEEEVETVDVSVTGRVVKGRVVLVTLLVHIAAAHHQQLQQLRVATPCTEHKGRVPVAIPHVDVTAGP